MVVDKCVYLHRETQTLCVYLSIFNHKNMIL